MRPRARPVRRSRAFRNETRPGSSRPRQSTKGIGRACEGSTAPAPAAVGAARGTAVVAASVIAARTRSLVVLTAATLAAVAVTPAAAVVGRGKAIGLFGRQD